MTIRRMISRAAETPALTARRAAQDVPQRRPGTWTGANDIRPQLHYLNKHPRTSVWGAGVKIENWKLKMKVRLGATSDIAIFNLYSPAMIPTCLVSAAKIIQTEWITKFFYIFSLFFYIFLSAPRRNFPYNPISCTIFTSSQHHVPRSGTLYGDHRQRNVRVVLIVI